MMCPWIRNLPLCWQWLRSHEWQVWWVKTAVGNNCPSSERWHRRREHLEINTREILCLSPFYHNQFAIILYQKNSRYVLNYQCRSVPWGILPESRFFFNIWIGYGCSPKSYYRFKSVTCYILMLCYYIHNGSLHTFPVPENTFSVKKMVNIWKYYRIKQIMPLTYFRP